MQLRPMVNIPKLGLLLGSQTKSSAGKGIYAFRGIPYAQSPVGELRFKVGIKKY
jgi:carboxylesterase 2